MTKTGNNPNDYQMVNKQIEVYLYSGILKIKRSELWIHAVMWMNHQNILNETNQTKKYMDSIYMKFKKRYNNSTSKVTGS